MLLKAGLQQLAGREDRLLVYQRHDKAGRDENMYMIYYYCQNVHETVLT